MDCQDKRPRNSKTNWPRFYNRPLYKSCKVNNIIDCLFLIKRPGVYFKLDFIETAFSLFYPSSEKCSMLQSEYDELETEHERLTARHSKLIQDIDNKEAHWKDRLIFYTRSVNRGFGLNVIEREYFFLRLLSFHFLARVNAFLKRLHKHSRVLLHHCGIQRDKQQ